MKLKLRLCLGYTICVDPGTKMTWTKGKTLESEITPFVANKIGAGVLEIVEEKKDGE